MEEAAFFERKLNQYKWMQTTEWGLVTPLAELPVNTCVLQTVIFGEVTKAYPEASSCEKKHGISMQEGENIRGSVFPSEQHGDFWEVNRFQLPFPSRPSIKQLIILSHHLTTF